jgi:hypothetical protein
MVSVQFFLHIFNKKFWLQFICNKLISTTAHESVKIISTKWVMHISHLISVNIFLENFDTFFLFDLLVLKHLTQLVNFIICDCESSAPFFVIYKAGREPTPY